MCLEHRRVNTCEWGAARSTNRHIHLRNGIVLKILVVVIVENFIIVEGYSFRSQHLREHLEFLMAKTLVLPLLFGPIILLR